VTRGFWLAGGTCWLSLWGRAAWAGCGAAATLFGSVSDLAQAMRRAAAAHGEHEKRIGAADPNWPDWYAAYMVAEQAGTELPA
jgi:hypothetical protein